MRVRIYTSQQTNRKIPTTSPNMRQLLIFSLFFIFFHFYISFELIYEVNGSNNAENLIYFFYIFGVTCPVSLSFSVFSVLFLHIHSNVMRYTHFIATKPNDICCISLLVARLLAKEIKNKNEISHQHTLELKALKESSHGLLNWIIEIIWNKRAKKVKSTHAKRTYWRLNFQTAD